MEQFWKLKFILYILLNFYIVGIEPVASLMLGKCSNTTLFPQLRIEQHLRELAALPGDLGSKSAVLGTRIRWLTPFLSPAPMDLMISSSLDGARL